MQPIQNVDIRVEGNILWLKIGIPTELHYSYKTICDFNSSLVAIENKIKAQKISHVIIVSNNKVWNMGGDLEMFCQCITAKNRALLQDYAYKCVEGVHAINNGFFSNVIVTCVVQGNAFGGGFECALAGNYIVAEEQAMFSFPEILFSTFPGMGAYSFLTRKTGYSKARDMISSTTKWTAATLQEYGLVHYVCKQGSGIETVLQKIADNELLPKDEFAGICTNVSLKELKDVVDIWLDNVLALPPSKINFMMKLVEAQKYKALKD